MTRPVDPLAVPNTKHPDNPWRKFIENCIEGNNYFRASEYRKLLADLDRGLHAIDRLAALAPQARPDGGERTPVDPLVEWGNRPVTFKGEVGRVDGVVVHQREAALAPPVAVDDQLRALIAAAEEALDSAASLRLVSETMHAADVDWDSVLVTGAVLSLMRGELEVVVQISGAAPVGNDGFRQYIADQLRNRGYDDVVVVLRA